MKWEPMLAAEMISVPAMIIRGGTSRGVYLLERDLPEDRSLWGPYLIDMFGARDVRQIDGIGGAMPTTSKCCIVGPSAQLDADVDYTFAQVGIGAEQVYWDFNCGNLTPGVGTFAILAGLVKGKPGTTTVRVYQTNTKMLLSVEVPTAQDGTPLVSGDYEIAGVTGTGPAVVTNFSRAVGASLGGALFPTGNRSDRIDVPGFGQVTVSIVDLANMCVFFHADALSLTGLEMPQDGPAVVDRFIAVREAAQELLGIGHAKTTPWPVSVAAPKSHATYNGGKLDAGDYDVAVRFAGIQPMRQTLHEAYPGTASVCTAVAAVTPGTVVHEIYADHAVEVGQVRIGHPSGLMTVEAQVRERDDEVAVERAVNRRTVRPIMRGELFVRRAEVRRLSELIPADEPVRAGVPQKRRGTEVSGSAPTPPAVGAGLSASTTSITTT